MSDRKLRVLLVTGMSGAGKTSALKCLEDMGYEAVDNIPLSLLGNLVLPRNPSKATMRFQRPIAIGVDIRTRDFGVSALVAMLAGLKDLNLLETKLLFLDCSDAALMRRYAETRHRHPLAAGGSIADGIAAERKVLAELRESADLVVDTTDLILGGLKQVLQRHFAPETQSELALFVTSFSYRRGLPRESDLVFDVRFLPDPADSKVGGADFTELVARDAGFMEFFARLTGFLSPLLPSYAAEGKSYLTISIGDGDGGPRAAFVADRLADWLRGQGWRSQLQHRDLENSRGGSRPGIEGSRGT
jgi:UPF0042 nucleotide-binding protein